MKKTMDYAMLSTMGDKFKDYLGKLQTTLYDIDDEFERKMDEVKAKFIDTCERYLTETTRIPFCYEDENGDLDGEFAYCVSEVGGDLVARIILAIDVAMEDGKVTAMTFETNYGDMPIDDCDLYAQMMAFRIAAEHILELYEDMEYLKKNNLYDTYKHF